MNYWLIADTQPPPFLIGDIIRQRRRVSSSDSDHSRVIRGKRHTEHELKSAVVFCETLKGRNPRRNFQVVQFHLLGDSSQMRLEIGKRLAGTDKITDFLPVELRQKDDLFTFGLSSPFLDGDQSWAATPKMCGRILLSYAPCLSSLGKAKSDEPGIDVFQGGHVSASFIQAAFEEPSRITTPADCHRRTGDATRYSLFCPGLVTQTKHSDLTFYQELSICGLQCQYERTGKNLQASSFNGMRHFAKHLPAIGYVVSVEIELEPLADLVYCVWFRDGPLKFRLPLPFSGSFSQCGECQFVVDPGLAASSRTPPGKAGTAGNWPKPGVRIL